MTERGKIICININKTEIKAENPPDLFFIRGSRLGVQGLYATFTTNSEMHDFSNKRSVYPVVIERKTLS